VRVAGPLTGVRVVEIAGIGPGPFAGMMLADAGADVIRVDRAQAAVQGANLESQRDVLARGRRSLAVDLKRAEGRDLVLRLVEGADALIEGFRPGVAERLGVGPDACLARNPRLVYGRMTGWGQDGPWAQMAGHDLDYIALAGALHPMGTPGKPPPVPLNLVGDFGGGGMLLAFGVVSALLEARASGRGQVVDAAMVDGTATLTAMFHGMLAMGLWSDERGANLLDGGAPFYRTYRCADGRYVAVGALEPQFYAALLVGLGLNPEDWPQHDQERWPAQAEGFAARFAERTRDEWAEVFAGTDACVAPVLTLTEAPEHEHLAARGTFTELAGVRQPAPAPRFSRTPSSLERPPAAPGTDTDAILAELGCDPNTIAGLRAEGVVA
jgi:alpha-methylacyl-CoA racemase